MSLLKHNTRHFLPYNFKLNTFEDLEPFLKELEARKMDNKDDLGRWLWELSELEAVVEEEGAWRYIKMTCNTTDEALSNNYKAFVTELAPKLQPYSNTFNNMLNDSPYKEKLPEAEMYRNYLRNVAKDIELYREENIPIQAEISALTQKYGAINGAMTIEHDGQELTMQQSAKYLKVNEREIREAVFRKIWERRAENHTELNDLLSQLVEKRHQIAKNAGFDNFRDYKFKSMGRFDYTVQDCRNFHNSIANVINSLIEVNLTERKQKLNLDTLRPWDTEVDPDNQPPLQPFENGEDLYEKGKKVLGKVDPYFADVVSEMKEKGHFDLDSRKGKAPGGYNYPLYETGFPFIFMNAAGNHSDIVTFVHEAGHAVHSVLSAPLKLTAFKGLTSEIAELASMSMELFTLDYWDEFYPNPADLKRAKLDQMERVLSVLPWVAQVDAFQHWLYENETHTAEQREEAWMNISNKMAPKGVDWKGLENWKKMAWQRQLHIYEVPFYYIEYGMAQLGAIAMWRNYKKDPVKAIEKYKYALSLGYTRSIPEIYNAAGIRFDFSEKYLQKLADFVREQIEEIKKS